MEANKGAKEEWLYPAFKTMPFGVVIHGADGSIEAVNPAACAILGLSADQLRGLTAHDPRWEAINPSGQPLTGDEHPVSIVQRTKQPVHDYLMGIHDPHRQDKRWIQVNATPQFAPDETTLQRVFVFLEDITQRFVAENSRKEAEERFQALFENSPIGAAYHRMIYDDDGKPIDYYFLDCNANYLKLTGVDPRNKRVTEAFPGIENDPFDWIGKFGHVATTGESIRFQQHLVPNDRWYDCVGYQTSPGKFVAAFLEITDQKRSEQALKTSEENLRITLESIGDAVIATDAQGLVTRMNRVAETLTGWSQNEAAGRPMSDVFRTINANTRSPCDDPVARVLATGQTVELANHTALIHRDGSERQIADSGAPIRNDANDIVGVVLVFRDVTHEYAMQEQIQQSRKLDAIGQLAGGISHDFNNMLGGIIGAAELLQKRLPADPTAEKYMGVIISAANRAAELTSKLLSFSRRTASGSTPVDVHTAITETVAILKSTVDRKITIDVDLAASVSQVVGDLTQLQSVFLNIAINATHAMPDGGQLNFRTQVVEVNASKKSWGDAVPHSGQYLEIAINDTGCGIPSDIQSRIFEPFFTTKEQGKGTGLGLSAALGTIQQHNGTIQVNSEPGAGTTFRILLPLTADASASLPPMHDPYPGTGRILLVDDEAIMRAIGTAILEELGYEVLAATQGADAISLLEAQTKPIDLVILDMIMPEMDGRTCFHKLRAAHPELPIILASGFCREDELDELRSHGLAGFLQKPFRSTDLSRIVKEALQK